MSARRIHQVRSSLQPSDHPYLNGAWTPVSEEWDDDDCLVIGEVPRDLDGVYLRNSENPVHQPLGKYHPFDGDGMLCAMRFHNGRAAFRNRFIRTRGFVTEQDLGRALWSGIAEVPPKSERPGWGAQGYLKDASSTDVCVHGGRAISSFYQCGELYGSDPVTLEQQGALAWGGQFPRDGVSAHAMPDPATGELLWFNYSRHAPFMRCGAASARGELLDEREVPLPGPRLPHSMMFTPRFFILNDFPLFWDAELLKRDIFAARMHELPSRFALVPRIAPGQTRWFEASPTYVLHFTNAWEAGDEVILDGYRQQCPMPPPLSDAPKRYAQMMAFLDLGSMKPQLWRWRFNLRTGQTREELLDETVCEFGSINRQSFNRVHRYVYSMSGEPGWFLFNGLIKHDLATGQRETVCFEAGVFGSETPFVPRAGARSEDDGWLVTYISDMNRNVSECWIYAAQNLAAGPLARVRLPLRIPSGTHACWAAAEELVAESARSSAWRSA
ncbi:MAG: carotenoid oxygenase family protein [Panacagrimonas sp.]